MNEFEQRVLPSIYFIEEEERIEILNEWDGP